MSNQPNKLSDFCKPYTPEPVVELPIIHMGAMNELFDRQMDLETMKDEAYNTKDYNMVGMIENAQKQISEATIELDAKIYSIISERVKKIYCQ